MQTRGRIARRCAGAALLGLVAAAATAADKDEIVTDRPDFVESSNVVGKGRFQVETSVALERSERDGVRERLVSTPTLLRFGIGDTLELRVETDGRLRARVSEGGAATTTSGYADTSVGVKWHARDAIDGAPSLGVLAHLDLDSGSRPFRAPGKGGSLRLAAEWELADDWSLGVMPGLAWQQDDAGARYVGGLFGVVLGKEWNDGLRSFVELSAPQIARGRHGGTAASVDVGLAWLPTPTVQLDTAIARGLNRRTADLSWTVGLSLKF
jgi:hypothetical protein